jgi:hypothetical protein
MSLTQCAYLPPGPANLTEKLFCHGHMGTITLSIPDVPRPTSSLAVCQASYSARAHKGSLEIEYCETDTLRCSGKH